MATMTYGNVINLQPGGPRVSTTSNRILMECRDLAARRLREALREILQKVGEDFDQRADTAVGPGDRRFILGVKDALREKGGRLEGQLAAHWTREFDAALKKTPVMASGDILLEEMQIVEYGEMDEELALKSLAHRLHTTYEDELYALGRRFNHLMGREDSSEGRNPAAPEVFTRALQGALRDMDFDTKSRLEICRGLDGYAVDYVGPIYHAINAQLLKHNILPNLRRDYSRSPSQVSCNEKIKSSASGDMFAMLQRLVTSGGSGTAPSAGVLPENDFMMNATGIAEGTAGPVNRSAPVPHVWASLETLQHAAPGVAIGHTIPTEGGNVLHHFRASEVGQGLGQLDAITVDIVAMLFDMIFDDREISDPIKALVGKLQIPVLKVAMLDRSFFSSKAHPTRRLLDLISQAALRWGRQVGHDDPIYQKISQVIDTIHKHFQQDTALFGTLCDDLERFLKEQETAASDNVSRAALLVIRRELDELADMAVDSELQTWLSMPLPKVVIDLLDHEWRSLLKRTHLDDGPDSEAWKSALKTAGDLVESASPKHDTNDRQTLVRHLPIILKQLSTGFDRIGIDNERRHALFDALFSLHANALRGSEPPPMVDEADLEIDTSAAVDEAGVISQALGDGQVTVESISLKMPTSCYVTNRGVEELQRGDWVEFMQADKTPIRYRLSWISPQRGIFLFTNPQSPHALAVSPDAMTLQLQRGEVRILSTEPMFDRALTRTIQTLQAA